MPRGMVSSFPNGLVDSSIPKELDYRFSLYDRLACPRPMHSAMNACDLVNNRGFILHPYLAFPWPLRPWSWLDLGSNRDSIVRQIVRRSLHHRSSIIHAARYGLIILEATRGFIDSQGTQSSVHPI